MTLATILMTSLAVPALGLGGSLPPRRPTPEGPEVVLWTNRSDDLFARGDRMSVFFRTDVDAYVTVFRIDADGHVQVVFPRTPADDHYVRGGKKYRARGPHHDYTLRVEEYPGEGFLFAIATLDPLPLHPYARGNHWDYAALGIPSRVTLALVAPALTAAERQPKQRDDHSLHRLALLSTGGPSPGCRRSRRPKLSASASPGSRRRRPRRRSG